MTVVPLEGKALGALELVELAKQAPVILTRDGKPVATVKDVSGSDWESIAPAANPRFHALIEAARRSYREHGGMGLDELRQELKLKATPKRAAPTGRKKRK